MSNSTYNMKLKAVDKMSAVLENVSSKFGKVSNKVKAANRVMNQHKRATLGVTKRLKDFSKSASKVGGNMTMKMSAPIAAFGALSLRTAVSFEQSMNKVGMLTGETGKNLELMRNQAKELGASTQFSASQAADAMSFLGMAGWETQEIMKGIPGVLDLAAVSGIGLGRAADITSNIMGAFNIDAANSAKVADVLARTTSAANVDMEMLAETMKYAAPVADEFGMSLNDTATMAGLLGNVGIQGSNAGTAIKNMMLGLSAPGSKAKKIMNELGVSVADSNGQMRTLPNILKDMGGAMKDLPKDKKLAVLKEVFGKISIAGAAKLVDNISSIGKEGSEFDKLSKKINSTDKTAKSMAATLNAGAPGAVKNLASAFEGLQIAIAESGLLEIFTKMVMKITDIFRSLAQNKSLLKFLTIMAGIAAILGPVILIFGKLAGAIGLIVANWGAIALVMKGVGAVIAAVAGGISAPFLAIGAAIAGVLTLIYKFRKEIASFASMGLDKIGGLIPDSVKSFFSFDSDSKEVPAIKKSISENKQINENRVSLILPKDVKADGPQIPGVEFMNTGQVGGYY